MKRSRRLEDLQSKQVFGGKTYACVSCKNGHRVKLCGHGKNRPISATKQPGRPAGGIKRGCKCPKRCNCAITGSCKCAKDCLCTEKMFLIVHIDSMGTPTRTPSPSPPPTWKEDGKLMTLKPIWADGDGKEINREEYEKRQAMRGMIESPDNSITNSSTTSKGCRDKTATSSNAESDEGNQTNSVISRCTCGSKCNCAFCPEHPNNSRSYTVAKATLEQMFIQGHQLGEDIYSNDPYISDENYRSCLGSQPRFILSSNENPSEQQLQHLPNTGYLIQYPVSMRNRDISLSSSSSSYPIQIPNQHYSNPFQQSNCCSTVPEGSYRNEDWNIDQISSNFNQIDEFLDDSVDFGLATVNKIFSGGYVSNNQTEVSPIPTYEPHIYQSNPNFPQSDSDMNLFGLHVQQNMTDLTQPNVILSPEFDISSKLVSTEFYPTTPSQQIHQK